MLVISSRDPPLILAALRHNLDSSARLVGHPAVQSVFPADGNGVRRYFSADSPPEQQIERLRIPLTDVCDHRSRGEKMEVRWWPEIQLTEPFPGRQAARRIGFGEGAGALVEISSILRLDRQLSCVRDFVWGGVDILQTLGIDE